MVVERLKELRHVLGDTCHAVAHYSEGGHLQRLRGMPSWVSITSRLSSN